MMDSSDWMLMYENMLLHNHLLQVDPANRSNIIMPKNKNKQ